MVRAAASIRVCVVLLAVFGPACSGGYGPQPFPDASVAGRAGAGGTMGMGVDAGPCTPTSCGSSTYCATCGPKAGQCLWRTLDCIYQEGPVVCGCDGQLYITPCQAELSAVALANDDRCAGPPGTFRCGTEYCTHGTQYCQAWYLSDVPTSTSQPYVAHYACGALAADCGATPTCACVTVTECSDCKVTEDGELTTMCRLR